MLLDDLFTALLPVFDTSKPIERDARAAMVEAIGQIENHDTPTKLAQDYLDILARKDAHGSAPAIANTPLRWTPPMTSNDPLYVEHSKPKAHVELVGPEGFAPSDTLRIGLYGMLSGHKYGIRTHPAEEVFIMLAGQALWKRGDADYEALGPGGRSYHPSMMPHANKTADQAFMSIYVWRGDISKENYVYTGQS